MCSMSVLYSDHLVDVSAQVTKKTFKASIYHTRIFVDHLLARPAQTGAVSQVVQKKFEKC